MLRKSHRASLAKQREIESYRTSVSQTYRSCLSQPCKEPGCSIAFKCIKTSYIWELSFPNTFQNRPMTSLIVSLCSFPGARIWTILHLSLPIQFQVWCNINLWNCLTSLLRILLQIKFDVFWTYPSWRIFVSALYLHLCVQSPGGVENLVLRGWRDRGESPTNYWN